MFTQHFKAYVYEGDSITCKARGGFTCTARLYQDDDNTAPDKRCDGFWPSLDPKNDGYMGPKSKSTWRKHMKRAKDFYKRWEDGEMVYCGVAVTVEKNGIELTDRYAHALWGVDCNYDAGGNSNRYLREVANELLAEALADARDKIARLAA